MPRVILQMGITVDVGTRVFIRAKQSYPYRAATGDGEA